MTRWVDTAVDAGIIGFAAWTIAYHVCLVTRLPVLWAWLLSLLLCAGAVVAWRRCPVPAAEPTSRPPLQETVAPATDPVWRDPRAVLVVLAALTAVLSATFDGPWTLTWVSWFVAVLSGGWSAWRRLAGPEPESQPSSTQASAAGLVVVLAWAVGMAVLALWSLGPSPDDVYYVNLAQWVADHGTFPLRDTLYADEVFPMSNWPPAASYDPLTGAVAGLLGLRAGTVVYLAVLPTAAFVATLGLWRLIRCWRIQPAAVVLTITMIMLLSTTGPADSPAEGFVVRLWQGKFLLAWVILPWVWAHLVAFYDRPSRRLLLLLFAGGVAAVGVSTTGIFLLPAMAVAGAVPLLRRSPRQALALALAVGIYPMATGVVSKLVGGRSADTFERAVERFSPESVSNATFHDGTAFLVTPAVLLAALYLPHRAARVTMCVLAFVFGLIMVPGVTELGFDVLGLGPTLRRFRHPLVIPLLVPCLLFVIARLLPVHRRVTVVVATVVATSLALAVGPVVRQPNESSLAAPLHWQREPSDLRVVDRIVADEPWDGRILLPDSLAVTLAVVTTRSKAVVPRDYYADYLRDDPRFEFTRRQWLTRFVNRGYPFDPASQPRLEEALERLDVAVACVRSRAEIRVAALLRAGMTPYLSTNAYRCFTSG